MLLHILIPLTMYKQSWQRRLNLTEKILTEKIYSDREDQLWQGRLNLTEKILTENINSDREDWIWQRRSWQRRSILTENINSYREDWIGQMKTDQFWQRRSILTEKINSDREEWSWQRRSNPDIQILTEKIVAAINPYFTHYTGRVCNQPTGNYWFVLYIFILKQRSLT